MKKIFAALVCLSLAAAAQAQDTISIKLKDLEVPTSPAFSLLDKTPSVIDRPASGKAFTLNVLSSVVENRGLPQNYAVEFTPFWYFAHPNMTALKYVGYVEDSTRKSQPYHQNPFSQCGRFSVSMAFVTVNDSLQPVPVSNFSAGFRVTLLSFYSKDQMTQIKKANDVLVHALKDQVARQDSAGITPALKFNNPAEYNRRLKEFLATDDATLDSLGNTLQPTFEIRPAFAVDFAFGYNHFFLNNNFYDNHFGRLGAWLTLNWSQPIGKNSSNYFNLYGVARYLADGTKMQPDTNLYKREEFLDFGMKAELEFRNFSFGYEYLYRMGPGNAHTYRGTGMLKYKISDTLYLTGAFGKNFGTSNNLITLLGINWGLSTGNENVNQIGPAPHH